MALTKPPLENTEFRWPRSRVSLDGCPCGYVLSGVLMNWKVQMEEMARLMEDMYTEIESLRAQVGTAAAPKLGGITFDLSSPIGGEQITYNGTSEKAEWDTA